MTYRGKYSKGTVILPRDVDIPEGAEVEVTPLAASVTGGDAGKWLLQFAGIVKDLPSDFAQNHDHYIHGSAKR